MFVPCAENVRTWDKLYKARPCKAWQPNGWNRHGNGFISAPEAGEQSYWQSARRESIGFGMTTPEKAETRLRPRYGC